MEKTKFDRNIFKRSLPAKTSKRFVCWVIDLILVALLAEVIFLGAFQITQSTSAYKDAQKTINDEIDYYEELTKETHIVEYVDGERVTTDVVVIKNLYRAICLSYEVFGNNQQSNFQFDADHDVMINGVHSIENDNVAYFYCRYLKNDPSIKIEAEEDLFEIYKRAFGENATFMFSFNKDVSELPVLNTQVAYYLFYYLFINSSDTIGQTGATYYETYYNGYSSMLEEAENMILQSEPYYSTHYIEYMEAFSAEARYTNITLVISIFISCLIVFLIPKYLFKNERSISYKLFGLGVVNLNGEANKWYVPLIKTVVHCFECIPIAFILYLFPPFNGGFEAMFVPVNAQQKLSLAWVIIIVMIISGISSAFGLFTGKKQNLLNIIFRDVVVDTHNLEEEESDEKNQGRSY